LNPSKSYNKNLQIRNDILSTLAYFDIFTYPLKQREIWLFLPNLYHHSEFEMALLALVDNGLIFKIGEFYSLQNNYAIAQRRCKGKLHHYYRDFHLLKELRFQDLFLKITLMIHLILICLLLHPAIAYGLQERSCIVLKSSPFWLISNIFIA
jgi:hypothetical protein